MDFNKNWQLQYEKSAKAQEEKLRQMRNPETATARKVEKPRFSPKRNFGDFDPVQGVLPKFEGGKARHVRSIKCRPRKFNNIPPPVINPVDSSNYRKYYNTAGDWVWPSANKTNNNRNNNNDSSRNAGSNPNNPPHGFGSGQPKSKKKNKKRKKKNYPTADRVDRVEVEVEEDDYDFSRDPDPDDVSTMGFGFEMPHEVGYSTVKVKGRADNDECEEVDFYGKVPRTSSTQQRQQQQEPAVFPEDWKNERKTDFKDWLGRQENPNPPTGLFQQNSHPRPSRSSFQFGNDNYDNERTSSTQQQQQQQQPVVFPEAWKKERKIYTDFKNSLGRQEDPPIGLSQQYSHSRPSRSSFQFGNDDYDHERDRELEPYHNQTFSWTMQNNDGRRSNYNTDDDGGRYRSDSVQYERIPFSRGRFTEAEVGQPRFTGYRRSPPRFDHFYGDSSADEPSRSRLNDSSNGRNSLLYGTGTGGGGSSPWNMNAGRRGAPTATATSSDPFMASSSSSFPFSSTPPERQHHQRPKDNNDNRVVRVQLNDGNERSGSDSFRIAIPRTGSTGYNRPAKRSYHNY